MTKIETDIIALIRECWGAGVADFSDPMNASLIDDLGADSLDIVELTMATEDHFHIEITDDEAEPFAGDTGCKTVRDFCALVSAKLGEPVS